MSIVTLSNYGHSFQIKLFKFLIQDRRFFFNLNDILKEEYFSDKEFRHLFKLINLHFNKFSELPNYDILKMYAKKISDDDYRQKLVSLINEISETDSEQEEFFYDTAYSFCRRNEIKDHMIDCVDLLEAEKYDEIEEKMMDLIKKINIDTSDHNYWEGFDMRAECNRYNLVETGWEQIDIVLNGGLGSGELGVVVAPPGAGKSHFLVNIATNAARKKKNVLFISLELYSTAVGTRIDANFTGIENDKIRFHKEIVKKELLRLKEEEEYGDILIKYFPTGSINVNQIKAYVNQIKAMGFKPDIICIDYADIIKSNRTYSDAHRLEQKSIYEDLRGMAGELQIPVWTASQSNKNALESEWVSIEHMAESFGKAMVSDVIFGLSRKVEQRLDNEGRLFLAKSRIGRDSILFPAEIDTSISMINVKEPDYDMIKDIQSGVKNNDQGRIKMSSRKKDNLLASVREQFE